MDIKRLTILAGVLGCTFIGSVAASERGLTVEELEIIEYLEILEDWEMLEEDWNFWENGEDDENN